MRIVLSLAFLVSVFSCNHAKKGDSVEKEDFVYDMYEPSEMSVLMNEMFAYNEKLRQEISKGNVPTEFPSKFLNIHTAELSEFKSRNETFQAYSKLFIESQEAIFDANSNSDIKERYNSAINLCVSCHTTECTGPIPKIKKLLMK